MEKISKLASENGILILSKSTCCLCYAVQMLFKELRVHPIVHEIDHDPEGKEMEKALVRMGCSGPVPAVFIGGKLVGSTNEVMSMHLSGALLPLLGPYQ
ncbi:glutaredoxin, partial [Genlisea aurea]